MGGVQDGQEPDAITGDAKYGDWIERTADNGIAATIPMTADGHVFYYSDYNPHGGTEAELQLRLVVLHGHSAPGGGRPSMISSISTTPTISTSISLCRRQ